MINTTSARVAIAVASSNGMRIPEWCEERIDTGGHRGTLESLFHHLDCGRVLAAVDRNPDAVRCWLLLAYSAEGYAPHKAPHVVTAELYRRYVSERNVRATPERLVAVARAVMEDLVQQYRTPISPGASPSAYAERIQIPQRQIKDYHRAIQSMQAMIDDMDAQGLGVVASELPRHIRDVA